MSVDELDTLLRRQDGVISGHQAMAVGLTVKAIRHRLHGSRTWQRLLPGVYAGFTGPVPDGARERAALLYAGPTSLLHAVTAAGRYGIRYLPADGRVHVLVGHAVQRRSTAYVVMHRTHLMPRAVSVNGLQCVPAARAVVDLTRDVDSLRTVRAVLADALHRRHTTLDRLEEVLAAGHSAGSALARRAVEDLRAGCRSAPECELRDLVATSSVLPEPEWNARVVLEDGVLLGVADAWWRDVLMSAEVNSREHHFAEADWESTMRRQAGFAAHGVLVVPVSPARLRGDPSGVLAELESAWLQRSRTAHPS